MNRSFILNVVTCALIVLPNNQTMETGTGKGKDGKQTLWILSRLKAQKDEKIKVFGTPLTTTCKYGDAVSFNGVSDGILIDEVPLKDLSEFTVEVIFKPESGGSFEQRFFHCGESQGDRVLIELRANPGTWYADAFIKVGEENLTLISPAHLHPLNDWYHLAYVNNNGIFTVYVNGKKELEGEKKLPSLKSGKTSIGMRQNEVSWFKGAIYEIRITPRALKTDEFLKY